MFERRLYFHVDWLLLGAILLLAGIGVAMIYSTTYVTLPDGRATPVRSSGPRSTRSVLGLVALLVCLTLDYRMLAENSLFLYGGLVAAARLRAVQGLDADGRAALDPSARSTCSRRSSAASSSR